MARERNNIYAVAADAVDLAVDTAGTIGSMVDGVVKMIGIGSSERGKSEEQADAAERVATTLRQEAEAVKPRSRKVKAKGGGRHPAKKRTRKAA